MTAPARVGSLAVGNGFQQKSPRLSGYVFLAAKIRAAGAKLFFLPPYSPDLNPIEQVFAKLKHLLRKAAERTIEITWKRIDALLDLFSPAEGAFRHQHHP